MGNLARYLSNSKSVSDETADEWDDEFHSRLRLTTSPDQSRRTGRPVPPGAHGLKRNRESNA